MLKVHRGAEYTCTQTLAGAEATALWCNTVIEKAKDTETVIPERERVAAFASWLFNKQVLNGRLSLEVVKAEVWNGGHIDRNM